MYRIIGSCRSICIVAEARAPVEPVDRYQMIL